MFEKVKDLMNIGLTENEAKVYCCLLKKHQFTATEISQCAGVNRSKIYSVLSSLTKRGLCTEKLGKVRRFTAVDPDVSFENIILEEKKKFERLNALPAQLSQIYASNKDISSPLDFIQVFSTAPSIIKKHHTLELESKNEVLSFCKPPYAMVREHTLHEEQIESMDSGVKFKSIYEVEEDVKFFAESMKSFEMKGEDIRVMYHLPIKLHVFDTHTVMFSMINKINPEESLTYLVIEHEDLAETLINTFNDYWEQALTVPEFLERENLT